MKKFMQKDLSKALLIVNLVSAKGRRSAAEKWKTGGCNDAKPTTRDRQ
jgi:hypothetical protein